MSWLPTCPSGSVKVCFAKHEADCLSSELKSSLSHPISLIELSWTISHGDIYVFHVNSWELVEKDSVRAPSASPAGLFSFEANVSSGRLLSVSPGHMDHASLLSFLQRARSLYPHRTQTFLEGLARTIAFESAFEMVRASIPLLIYH